MYQHIGHRDIKDTINWRTNQIQKPVSLQTQYNISSAQNKNAQNPKR